MIKNQPNSMKTPRTRRKRQLGISLVEMGIAAAVVGILLMGILVGLPKVQLNARLDKARQEIPQTIDAMTLTYVTQANTDKVSLQFLSLANAWPANRVTDSGKTTAKVNGVFPGSDEQVFSNTTTSVPRLTQNNQGFSYWLHNVPKEACLPLVQLLITHRSVAEVSVSDASKAKPGGGRGATTVTTNTRSTLYLDMTKVATACSTEGRKSINAQVSRT